MSNETLKTIQCNFPTEAVLYKAYMPFLDDGGLFIRTNHTFNLGDELVLNVTLLDEPAPYTINAKVVWITPKGAQGGKPAGIGAQFMGEQARQVSNKIETVLAGMLKSTQLTDTM